MWTFEIKPSTLLVMMTVVLVRSSVVREPDPCEKLLQDIKVQVTNLSNATWKNILVPKPTQRRECPKNFFCLAEKVLESITQEPEKTIFSTLTNTLKRYNNSKNCSTHCKLNTNQRYYLQMFLEHVKECLSYPILSKSKK